MAWRRGSDCNKGREEYRRILKVFKALYNEKIMDIEGKLFVRERLLLNPNAVDYVSRVALTNIDKGSEFENTNRNVLQSNDPLVIINDLAERGYDVMLGYHEGQIIGHTVFQEHERGGNTYWEMFNLFVPEHLKERGYAFPLAKRFLDKGLTFYKTRGIKLGKPRGETDKENEKMVKLLRILSMKEKQLGISVDRNTHWVTLEGTPLV